jgi:hypothetical protein
MLYREIIAVCTKISSTSINAHVERLSAKPAGARNMRCGCQSVSPDHPLTLQLYDKYCGPVQKIEMQFLLSKCILFTNQLLAHTAYIYRIFPLHVSAVDCHHQGVTAEGNVIYIYI